MVHGGVRVARGKMMVTIAIDPYDKVIAEDFIDVDGGILVADGLGSLTISNGTFASNTTVKIKKTIDLSFEELFEEDGEPRN